MTEKKQVLFDADVEAEFGFNKNFLNRHSKELGGRGRPRKFLRQNVEAFVLVYFSDALMEKQIEKAEKIRRELAVSAAIHVPIPPDMPLIGKGKILNPGQGHKTSARREQVLAFWRTPAKSDWGGA